MSWAAHRQDSQFLTMALAHGGDPNLRSHPAARYNINLTPTPIYHAIRGRNPENVRILLKAGADLEARNSAGWTPLMEAASQCAYDVMYLLLEAGAHFRVRTNRLPR